MAVCLDPCSEWRWDGPYEEVDVRRGTAHNSGSLLPTTTYLGMQKVVA
jgi:hypothetical protein